MAVQWLRLHASIAWSGGLIPNQGTKITHVSQCNQKKKKKKAAVETVSAKVLRWNETWLLQEKRDGRGGSEEGHTALCKVKEEIWVLCSV